ncbi:MAG: SDR family NAD(P)-dependent oxidoreductase [Hyphomonadaceae bacterium]|nr:SDR family NAD(P)-dependent oxidoreductase [Hyphomonadaceae bacterium]
MTGGTAGIGLAAVKEMRRDRDVRVLVGARGADPSDGDRFPLDLGRLENVRSFASIIERARGETAIDALVLNAGLQFSDVAHRTEDGYETTFAVNHLAHFLLLRLLMPALARNAIVVITSSNLHDPRLNKVAPPQHADIAKLARGEGELDGPRGAMAGLRLYAASKLLNIMTARALATSPFARERGLRVIAYNPGLTPGTKLTRSHPTAFRIPHGFILSILAPIQRMNTVAGGGKILADLALGAATPPVGEFYASHVKRRLEWTTPSEAVMDESQTAKVWRDSAIMLNLPQT